MSMLNPNPINQGLLSSARNLVIELDGFCENVSQVSQKQYDYYDNTVNSKVLQLRQLIDKMDPATRSVFGNTYPSKYPGNDMLWHDYYQSRKGNPGHVYRPPQYVQGAYNQTMYPPTQYTTQTTQQTTSQQPWSQQQPMNQQSWNQQSWNQQPSNPPPSFNQWSQQQSPSNPPPFNPQFDPAAQIKSEIARFQIEFNLAKSKLADAHQRLVDLQQMHSTQTTNQQTYPSQTNYPQKSSNQNQMDGLYSSWSWGQQS